MPYLNGSMYIMVESLHCSPETVTILLIGYRFSGSVKSISFDPMDCSTPVFPVHHQFPELTQTHVH